MYFYLYYLLQYLLNHNYEPDQVLKDTEEKNQRTQDTKWTKSHCAFKKGTET